MKQLHVYLNEGHLTFPEGSEITDETNGFKVTKDGEQLGLISHGSFRAWRKSEVKPIRSALVG